MRALKFYQTGSLDDLRVEEVTVPIPAEGEVLVEVKAAAINPSDIKNVQGKMHETTVPRIPGRDFAGMIVKGPDERLGQSVFGSGGNLGFGRDGSHAQYLAVPATAVLPLPRNLGFEQAAGIGVAYITAWGALVNAAQLYPYCQISSSNGGMNCYLSSREQCEFREVCIKNPGYLGTERARTWKRENRPQWRWW